MDALANHERVLQQLSSFRWQRKKTCSVINILAQALYALFAAKGSFYNPDSADHEGPQRR
jgi:squalene monooxygenase